MDQSYQESKFKIKEFLNQDLIPNDVSPHRISIAPMMDVSNSYFRVFMRMLTREATVYTEMIHENALLKSIKKGDQTFMKLYQLNYFQVEHPIVCQLGGNNPQNLAQCAKLCENYGYDEVNLNVGCPSSKVQHGAFGACLMKEADLVSECVLEMKKAVSLPITVKCRLGVDDFDSYEFVKKFVDTVIQKGQVKHFIIHARKAFLQGLNPEQNRNIPPLKYEWVIKLKQDFPDIQFSINGGFTNLQSINEILDDKNKLLGCMIGRVCYQEPWVLNDIDRQFFKRKNPGFTRREIIESWGDFGDYVMNDVDTEFKVSIPSLCKPIIQLFKGEKHGNNFRVYISNPDNFKTHGNNFGDLMQGALEMLDTKENKEQLLDIKPPCDN